VPYLQILVVFPDNCAEEVESSYPRPMGNRPNGIQGGGSGVKEERHHRYKCLAQYLGDGLPVYVVYPGAHGDEAQGAAHSGLESMGAGGGEIRAACSSTQDRRSTQASWCGLKGRRTCL
jgi:hypothetical protein